MARWEGRRERRLINGPWRDGWPALAADRTSYGADPTSAAATTEPAATTGQAAAAGGAGPTGPLGPAGPTGPLGRTLTTLPEFESLALLASAGLSVVEAVAVTDAPGAVQAARRLGGAVALKLDATDLAHKSDLGGVALGLLGDDVVLDAAVTLLEVGRRHGLTVRGLLVEPMAPPGVELILGLRRDPQFGPVVLVGLGGTLAEVLDDVAIRLAPLSLMEAQLMLDELRGARVLNGVRGRLPVDRAAVASMLVALGQLGVERPDVLEVDLNPVIASEAGALAVDALVVLEGPES